MDGTQGYEEKHGTEFDGTGSRRMNVIAAIFDWQLIDSSLDPSRV